MPMGAKSKFCNALDLEKQGSNTSSYPRIERAHMAPLWASQAGNEVPPKAAPHTVGCTKENPRLCRGEKKALAENKEIKRIPQ